MNKKHVKQVRKAAILLMATSGRTTTLEIKNYLRATKPKQKWSQMIISQTMIDIFNSDKIDNLTYVDNGKFREYFLSVPIAPTTPNKSKTKAKTKNKVVAKDVKATKISKSKAVSLIKESKGRFFTVKFLKKDKSVRILNGNVKLANFMNNQGYINVKEKNGDQRQINPRTIQELRISGSLYTVK